MFGSVVTLWNISFFYRIFCVWPDLIFAFSSLFQPFFLTVDNVSEAFDCDKIIKNDRTFGAGKKQNLEHVREEKVIHLLCFKINRYKDWVLKHFGNFQINKATPWKENDYSHASFFNPLRANPTKWSDTLKQFVGNSGQIVWVCLTILWKWHLKGLNQYLG